ncbi:MAG: nucleotide-binding universal stress UspA family protein [Bacteroidia bacterium]|jgi:nucleotide-binding universal stress UspA family protein
MVLMIEADLTEIATHGHNGIGHVFLGSKTEGLINHKKIPILSTRISD